MRSLAERYSQLKTSIGGNREKMSYEETFGLPEEERFHVTPINKYNRRIISEIGFALTLSEETGKFDDVISSAIDFLLAQIENQGVLTKDDCFKAEEMLLPLEETAKEYHLILAAHAHIDMNWMWGWQETVAATLATFHTMINIMDEYPDFCFSQSQASVYKIVEQYDPDLMERIKEKIKEGRWEITATAWVETDKNMPNTESLLRHIKYTRDYLQEHWDIDPNSLELDFSPDTFGHSANVPEINLYGNVKYYYHCRGLDGNNALYRWRSPSGKELLMYREQHWYNSAITPHIAMNLVEISRQSGGFKTGLIVYGVGDHGGGPTRRDVERAIEMKEWKIFPQIRFGTMIEFFKEAESVRDKLPLVDHEINYVSPGCYTTQSRLKLANRKNEKALCEADAISSLAHMHLNYPYQAKQFESAWQNVLFTHFHDILTGSCVQESREHAMGLFADSMAVANTQHSNALRAFAANIDTSSIEQDNNIKDSQSEGAGVGYGLSSYTGIPVPERGNGLVRIFHMFNSLSTPRTAVAEITVWDWRGDMRYIDITDTDNNPLPFALIDHVQQDYWSHKFFKLLVEVTVPPMGYTTIVMKQKERTHYRHYLNNEIRGDHPYKHFVLENAYIKAEFDYKNGNMISLIDKETNSQLLQDGKSAQLQFVHTESRSSSAWSIGRYTSSEDIVETVRIIPMNIGDLRTGFTTEKKIKNSIVRETVYLDKNAKSITYQLNVDWSEIGTSNFVPVLTYNFPHAYQSDEYLFDIPAGAQTRHAQYMDVPGLQYGAAINPQGKSVAIISDCKYGYRGADNQLILTLINSSVSPDPYPERGIHNITLSVGVEVACPKALEELATAVNSPIQFISGNHHKGSLPLEQSLLEFSGSTAVISCVTTADNGDLLVRFYENCGEESDIKITLPSTIQNAVMVDLMGNEIGTAQINGNTVTACVKPYSIGAVRIK